MAKGHKPEVYGVRVCRRVPKCLEVESVEEEEAALVEGHPLAVLPHHTD
eukprot:CAMPEP_0196736762 /NCGR_PEP_ID=MMETSP1091-20130531/14723_1 /TAXON_ID=302021 /ORGANISM="Rhodomonas sp., Strain CCMP768" /LENGTH=48 /DNA_ID= /DNA_START= /DNA_END= /DNA_ORIENTATION=